MKTVRMIAGYDIASEAYYFVQPTDDGFYALLRSADGEAYRFGEQDKTPKPLLGEMRIVYRKTMSDLIIPSIRLYQMTSEPDSVQSVTKNSNDYVVDLRADYFEPKDDGDIKLNRPNPELPERLKFGLGLEFESIQRSTLAPDPLSLLPGFPQPLTLKKQLRSGWTLAAAEFVAEGSPERFELAALMKMIREKMMNARQAMGPGPTLSELASGIDSKGKPIIVGTMPGLDAEPKRDLSIAIALSGAVVVLIGLLAWWKRT